VAIALTTNLQAGRDHRAPLSLVPIRTSQKAFLAEQLMAHDALGAHARDELGISEALSARPIQAALASAGSFAVGAAMPLLVTAIAPESVLIPLVSGTSLLFLTLLGGLAARAGGAGVMAGAIRVTFWGALAMAVTAGVGALFGTVA
jgi:VIT1/CCC1 family predicted Fe2+/Mn2+ transporter